MVQRLDIAGKYLFYPKDEGRFVKYEDYAALERDFRDYITTTEMELKELREKLGLSN